MKNNLKKTVLTKAKKKAGRILSAAMALTLFVTSVSGSSMASGIQPASVKTIPLTKESVTRAALSQLGSGGDAGKRTLEQLGIVLQPDYSEVHYQGASYALEQKRQAAAGDLIAFADGSSGIAFGAFSDRNEYIHSFGISEEKQAWISEGSGIYIAQNQEGVIRVGAWGSSYQVYGLTSAVCISNEILLSAKQSVNGEVTEITGSANEESSSAATVSSSIAETPGSIAEVPSSTVETSSSIAEVSSAAAEVPSSLPEASSAVIETTGSAAEVISSVPAEGTVEIPEASSVISDNTQVLEPGTTERNTLEPETLPELSSEAYSEVSPEEVSQETSMYEESSQEQPELYDDKWWGDYFKRYTALGSDPFMNALYYPISFMSLEEAPVNVQITSYHPAVCTTEWFVPALAAAVTPHNIESWKNSGITVLTDQSFGGYSGMTGFLQPGYFPGSTEGSKAWQPGTNLFHDQNGSIAYCMQACNGNPADTSYTVIMGSEPQMASVFTEAQLKQVENIIKRGYPLGSDGSEYGIPASAAQEATQWAVWKVLNGTNGNIGGQPEQVRIASVRNATREESGTDASGFTSTVTSKYNTMAMVDALIAASTSELKQSVDFSIGNIQNDGRNFSVELNIKTTNVNKGVTLTFQKSLEEGIFLDETDMGGKNSFTDLTIGASAEKTYLLTIPVSIGDGRSYDISVSGSDDRGCRSYYYYPADPEKQIITVSTPVELNIPGKAAGFHLNTNSVSYTISKLGKNTDGFVAGTSWDLYNTEDEARRELEHPGSQKPIMSFELSTGIAETVAIPGKDVGNYYLVERNSSPYTEKTTEIFVISGQNPDRINLTNEEYCVSVRVEKTDDESHPLSGAVFSLLQWDGDAFINCGTLTDQKDGSYTVGSYTLFVKGADGIKAEKEMTSGILYATDVNQGRYQITETKNPEGYSGTASWEITIDEENHGKTLTFQAANQKITACFELTKEGLDSTMKQTPLSGAVFGVFSTREDADKLEHAVTEIVTGEDGYGKSESVVSGNYWIREMTAPEGYQCSDLIYGGEKGYTVDGSTLLISVPVEANIPQNGELKLVKTEEGSETGVSGAVYGIFRSREDAQNASEKDHNAVEILTTDQNGCAQAELEAGIYWVRELKAPEGYLLSDTIYEGTDGLVIGWGKETELTVTDQFPTLAIRKRDEAGNAVKGAVLALFDEEGTELYRWTTGAEEEQISKLNAGKYYTVKELETPFGYRTAEDITVLLKETSEVQVIEMTDPIIYGKVRIIKTDRNTGAALEQVRYQIVETASGSVVDTISTNAEGIACSRELPIGSYRDGKFDSYIEYSIEEISAAPGYVKNTKVETFQFENTENLSFVEKLYRETNGYTTVEITKSSVTDCPVVPGALLRVSAAEDIVHSDTGTLIYHAGDVIAEWVSEKEPHCMERLPEGAYILTEYRAPFGFTVAEPVRFYVKGTEEIQKVEMVDDEVMGRVVIDKKDLATQQALAGIEYTIRNQSGEVAEVLCTDENGHAESGLLPIGTFTADGWSSYYLYSIQETKTISGYILDDTSYSFGFDYVNDSTPVVVKKFDFTNDFTKLEITKTSATGDCQEVPGAELVIRNAGGEEVERWISTTEPHYLERLPIGTYTLTELRAPFGYTVAETISFEIKNHAEVVTAVMVDDEVYGKVRIHKTDKITGDSLEGVAYEVICRETGNRVDTLTTDANGLAESVLLPIGTYASEGFTSELHYFVKEIKSLSGYLMDEKEIEVVFEYQNDQTSIIDVNLELTNDFTKVQITKTDVTGDCPELPGAELLIRDSNGTEIERWISETKPHMIERLPVGTYTLTEIRAPFGYAVAETVEFTVEETAEIQAVKMIDEELYGIVQIHKTDADTGRPLGGVSYEIYCIETGRLVETLTTDQNGFAESGKLPLATLAADGYTSELHYTLQESQTKDGYVLDSEIIEIILKQDPDELTIPKILNTYDFTNTQTKVKIQKTDEQGKLLPGAKLQILDQKGKVIDSWISEEDAHEVFGILLAGESYTLKEIKAPEGYDLAEEVVFDVPLEASLLTIQMKDPKKPEVPSETELESKTETKTEPETESERPTVKNPEHTTAGGTSETEPQKTQTIPILGMDDLGSALAIGFVLAGALLTALAAMTLFGGKKRRG